MFLMALPNEHLLTFSQSKDAKTLFEAIQARFGGNNATKKTQRTLLKQMYENFNAPSIESLDSIFNRLQKIISQLAIMGENISQEDLNMKFLRSLPSEWNTHVVVWRNKADLDTMSIDDLYNNFKNYLEQIYEDDLEERDLKWQLALLSMRTRRYFQRIGKKITINGSDIAGYDKTKVECFNCQDSLRKPVNVEDTSSKAMVQLMKQVLIGATWIMMKFQPTWLLWLSQTQRLGFTSYNAVAHLPTGLFVPPSIDLSNSGLEDFQHPEFKGYGPKDSNSVCVDTSNEIKKVPDALIIED
nr:hypothetical protein [Tanacetum cinerariifolium]